MRSPPLVDAIALRQADEICAVCGRVIGQLEQPYVWDQSIVCFGCHRDLSQDPLALIGDPATAVPTPERVYHADACSRITRSRIVLEGITYPMSEVRSARLQKLSPRRVYPIMVSLGGLSLTLVGLNRHLDRLDATLLIAGLMALLVGAFTAMGLRATYKILLLVNDREVPAFRSRRRKYAHLLLDTIGEAIVERGQFVSPPPPPAKMHPERRPGLEL